MEAEIDPGPRRSKQQYEIMWERDPALPEIIHNAWNKAGPKGDLGEINSALKGIMGSLSMWSKRKFGHVIRDIEKSRTRLEELMAMKQICKKFVGRQIR